MKKCHFFGRVVGQKTGVRREGDHTKQSTEVKERPPLHRRLSGQMGSCGEWFVQGTSSSPTTQVKSLSKLPVRQSRSLESVRLMLKTGTQRVTFLNKDCDEVFPLAPLMTICACADLLQFQHHGEQAVWFVLPGYFCQSLVPWECAVWLLINGF